MCGRYLTDEETYADIWEMTSAATQAINLSRSSVVAAQPPARTTGAVVPTGISSLSTLPRGEVFPANIAPIITNDGAEAVKWGFPHWKGAGVIINARSETAAEKSMFRKPLLERRCVIPSSGFFEWDRVSGKKKKDKYLLRRPGEHVLFMAGMINSFRDADGQDYSAFVILTTAANSSVAPIHDRMPVILAPDERDRWLSDNRFMEYALHRPGPELDRTYIAEL